MILNAALKMAAVFIVSTLVLGGTLWFALPTLEQYVLSFYVAISTPSTFHQHRSTPSQDPKVVRRAAESQWPAQEI